MLLYLMLLHQYSLLGESSEIDVGSSINKVSRPGDLELKSGSHVLHNLLCRTPSLSNKEGLVSPKLSY